MACHGSRAGRFQSEADFMCGGLTVLNKLDYNASGRRQHCFERVSTTAGPDSLTVAISPPTDDCMQTTTFAGDLHSRTIGGNPSGEPNPDLLAKYAVLLESANCSG